MRASSTSAALAPSKELPGKYEGIVAWGGRRGRVSQADDAVQSPGTSKRLTISGMEMSVNTAECTHPIRYITAATHR